jgi:hypothetical protein
MFIMGEPPAYNTSAPKRNYLYRNEHSESSTRRAVVMFEDRECPIDAKNARDIGERCLAHLSSLHQTLRVNIDDDVATRYANLIGVRQHLTQGGVQNLAGGCF